MVSNKQKVREDEETVFIFAIGTNDSYYIHTKNKLMPSHEELQNNIKKLINLAKKFSSKIIFIGLTPVNEKVVNPIPWDTDKFYKNEDVQKYNEIIKSVCKENNLHFIEIFDEFKKIDYEKLLEDGLHPNSKGHEKIFEIIKGFLIDNKTIQ